jgi:hypothetical protein
MASAIAWLAFTTRFRIAWFSSPGRQRSLSSSRDPSPKSDTTTGVSARASTASGSVPAARHERLDHGGGFLGIAGAEVHDPAVRGRAAERGGPRVGAHERRVPFERDRDGGDGGGGPDVPHHRDDPVTVREPAHVRDGS